MYALRNYTITTFFNSKVKIPFLNNLEWQDQNPLLYHTIHSDILTSDFASSFLNLNHKATLKFKTLFEQFFIAIFSNLPSSLYYIYNCNLIDLFVPIFLSFVTMSSVLDARKFFFTTEADFKPFYGNPEQFYSGFDVLLNVSSHILRRLVKCNLSQDSISQFSVDVLQRVEKENIKLHKILIENNFTLDDTLVIGFGIQYIQSIDVKCTIVQSFLEFKYAEKVLFVARFIISLIFSVQQLIISTDFFQKLKCQQVQILHYSEINDQLVIQCLKSAFQDTINIKILTQLIQDAQLSISNSNKIKAVSVSTGVLGVVGGVAGVILGLVFSK
ncbi:Transmembrane domain-containing protein [Spironucleus salmonicida]|uniref:Transmembrane domain-containing protein n=2 Tax=Spironucleus salmonicida TaxID=348837 RepID=A0A9P8RXA8_9EUKA|nr:Transmembrane domain-containing protein [Spironucleus salmonicida]